MEPSVAYTHIDEWIVENYQDKVQLYSVTRNRCSNGKMSYFISVTFTNKVNITVEINSAHMGIINESKS